MVARVLLVTRRDVRTVPVTLRNRVRACVWKCVCRPAYTYLGSTIHPSYTLFCTRPHVILETATLLFLQKIEWLSMALRSIQKRLDEIIDQENNQLRVKFVVNNWNNILDICENIQTCFKLSLRKNQKKLWSFVWNIWLSFYFYLYTSNDKLSTFYQEKVGFERNEENFIRRRKNDCVISTRFGGCRQKGCRIRKATNYG